VPVDDETQLRIRILDILSSAERLGEIGLLLGSRVTERRLRMLGLWNVRVACVSSGPINTYSTDWLAAGEWGSIGWSYPVSASRFAFEIEAPVSGLSSFPHETVGVPWRMLKAMA